MTASYGPVVAGGRPRAGGPDWMRLLAMTLVLALTAVGLSAATVAYVAWNAAREIAAVELPDRPAPEPLPGDPPPPDVDDDGTPDPVTGRQNILIVGSDSRAGLSDEQLLALGTEDEGSDLTDTVILLQLEPSRDVAAMLSFPRDLLVDRCDGTPGRINSAFYVGELIAEGNGPNCLLQTIEDLTRIPIDHYVRINFAGFIQVVDAVGGVTFYVDQPLEDAFAGLDIPAGCVTFDGTRALGFVRARHLDSGGDFGRIARQQRFARELLRKATSVGTLANPVRLVDLISSLSDTVETDTGLTPGLMIDLVESMRTISAGGVDVRTVPAVNRNVGGGAYVDQIDGEAEALYRAFRTGATLPDAVGAPGQPVELGPENVQPLFVLNGTATEGLAEEAAEALETRGFAVAETGSVENFGFDDSVVFYPEGLEEQAQLVADALGGVDLVVGAAEDGLRVIVGAGFDAAALPEVVEAAGLTPTQVPEIPVGDSEELPPDPEPLHSDEEPVDEEPAEEPTDEAPVDEEPVEEEPVDEEPVQQPAGEDDNGGGSSGGGGSGGGSGAGEDEDSGGSSTDDTADEDPDADSGGSSTGGDSGPQPEDLSERDFLGAELSDVQC